MADKFVDYSSNWAQYRQAEGECLPNQNDPSLFTCINFAFDPFGFVSWSVAPMPMRARTHCTATGFDYCWQLPTAAINGLQP